MKFSLDFPSRLKSPRKGVNSNFNQSKKSLENFSSGFTNTNKKDTTRVLNMKDMNNKNNLNVKINHCFGDFYKKLDTFADRAKKSEKMFYGSGKY